LPTALIELQQKGRLVGIISHVDKLKQQLEHGIEIRFAPGESGVRVGAIAA
jgi:exonuclease SbcC